MRCRCLSPSPSLALLFAFLVIFLQFPLTMTTSDAVTIKIVWWDFPPYIYKSQQDDFDSSANQSSWDSELDGVYKRVLQNLFRLCLQSRDDDNSTLVYNISTRQVNNSLDLYAVQKDPAYHNCTLVFVGVSTRREEPTGLLKGAVPEGSGVFLRVLETPGSVHFYKKEAEPVGSDLLTVIVQGWPLLVLILLGAGYSGIIIWLLDRLWNPANFPKPFIRGFWEGFWWAFVTMTTVGYGDTTPRSIQARIYGLIWIVVGITILSVFTATVTTVLTQESLGARQAIAGLEIGVLNGTDELRLVVTKGGHPVVCSSFEQLLTLLRPLSGQVHGPLRGAVVDQFYFAYMQHLLEEDMLIEQLVSQSLDQGLVVQGPHTHITECLQKHVAAERTQAFLHLTTLISPLTTSTTTAAESAQTLFQPRTIMYMWYGLGAWLIIFVAFVIWEFTVWRPKHKRRQAKKASHNVEGDNHDPCASSSFKSRKSTQGNFSLPRPANSTELRSKKIHNGFLGNQHHARFYANKGFLSDSNLCAMDRNVFTSSQGTTEHTIHDLSDSLQLSEVTSLDNLLRKQKEELDALQEEMSHFKDQWEKCLLALRDKHKAQRCKVLKLLEQKHGVVHNYLNQTSSSELENKEITEPGGASPINIYHV